MDLAAILPTELVREIYGWVRLFQQRDAIDRVLAFQQVYRLEWDTIMADVRMNVPRYTFVLTSRSGRPLRVSVYSPDCDPEMWPGSHQNGRMTVTRRVATIHAEFIRTQNQSPSVFLLS